MKKLFTLFALGYINLFVISVNVYSQIPAANLQLWLRADSGVTIDINGKVSQWNDQSGHNKNATNATIASQPVLTNNLLNNHPGITFSGSQILNIPAIDFTSTQKLDFFIVYKTNNTSIGAIFENSTNYNSVTNGFLIADNDASSPNSLGGLSVDLKGDVGYNIVSLNQAVNIFKIANAQFDKSLSFDEAKIFINGILQSRATNTYNNNNSNFFGNNTSFVGARSGGIAPWAGDVAEIILYNKVLSSFQRDSVVNYLGTKYDILKEICNGIDDDFNGMIDETCPPLISINDRGIDEGNIGTQGMKFTVSLNHPYIDIVKVQAATADSTATAPGDYLALSPTIKFNPGETKKRFYITVNGDITVEKNERFKIILSNPVNASIVDGLCIGTIKNDDANPLFAKRGNTTVPENQLLKIWPNPATDLVNIELPLSFGNIISVQLLNTNGIVVKDFKGSLSAKQTNQQLNISGIADGIYMLQIKDDKGHSQEQKILVGH